MHPYLSWSFSQSNEDAACHENERLVPSVKVMGRPVTSKVKAVTKKTLKYILPRNCLLSKQESQSKKRKQNAADGQWNPS